MRITDVYVGYLKITRIIQIGSILVKHGFKEMISHTFLGRRIRKRRIRQHKPVYTTQERLRLTIEDLVVHLAVLDFNVAVDHIVEASDAGAGDLLADDIRFSGGQTLLDLLFGQVAAAAAYFN